jgi:hypothetical protein
MKTEELAGYMQLALLKEKTQNSYLMRGEDFGLKKMPKQHI